LASFDGQTDIIHRGKIAELFREVFYFYDRFHHLFPHELHEAVFQLRTYFVDR
jgi:hypothetical protein